MKSEFSKKVREKEEKMGEKPKDSNKLGIEVKFLDLTLILLL